MNSVCVCVCVHGQVMDLDLGDPGVTDRVDDLLRLDGDTTIEQEKEGDESGMILGGEGMCADGDVVLEELRQHYEWIDKQNEVGKEESMSVSGVTSIGGGNNRPSPESTSVIDGDSTPKRVRGKRHVFTPLEKEILVNLYNTNKLKDTKDIHDVVVLLQR